VLGDDFFRYGFFHLFFLLQVVQIYGVSLHLLLICLLE
jgi:hypothetical protein